MSNLLSHSLFAIILQAVVGFLFGFPLISTGIFLAGILALLPNLDCSELMPNHRTPYSHSVFFGIIWTAAAVVVLLLLYSIHHLQFTTSIELSLAVATAMFSHLFLDFFTEDGIFIFPKRRSLKHVFRGINLGDERMWKYWEKVSSDRLGILPKKSGDALFNLYINVPSLALLIVYVGVS